MPILGHVKLLLHVGLNAFGLSQCCGHVAKLLTAIWESVQDLAAQTADVPTD